MECIRKFSTDAVLVERLELALFTFVASLSDPSRISGTERKGLVVQLINRLAGSTDNWTLRQTAGALLLKTAGPSISNRVELNVWMNTLERFPEAIADFAEMCSSLEPSDEPLLHAAWNCANGVESIGSYMTAVSCELVLSAQDPKSTASALLKSASKNRLSPSLKAFLQPLTKSKGKRCDPSTVGLSRLAVILCQCSFAADDSDLDGLKDEWIQELDHIKDRPDKLEVVLHQALGCMFVNRAKSMEESLTDTLKLLGILLNPKDSESNGHLLRASFLRNSLTLEWFDPLESDDSFISEFSSLVRDSLQQIREATLVQTYQRKFVNCIESVVRGEVSFKLPDMQQELLLSLSELKMDEIEPIIASMIKKGADSALKWLPYLELLLKRVARLRLEGTEQNQRISWPVFSQVLQLFVSLGACTALHQGLTDVVSAYPEFLDSTKEFTDVLAACLNSDVDCSSLCHLLTSSSAALCTALGKWFVEHEEKVQDINWRLQTLPPYLLSSSPDVDNLLETLHRITSPLLVSLLINRAEYQQTIEKLAKLPEFLHILISRCWSPEECRDVAAKILSQHKAGLICTQFVDVGRRGAHFDLHAKLCLRATVQQLKSDSPDPAQVQQLADEFSWLAKQTKSELISVADSVLKDPTWSKFLKYTLRVNGDFFLSDHLCKASTHIFLSASRLA